MLNKKKIIIDCDPGHDDAIALMIALNNPAFEVLAVCTECGNQTLEKTTRNAINICTYLGSDVKIASGVSKPIIKEVEVCEQIHGKTGLDGFDFPKYDKVVEKDNAIELMIELLMENDDVTVVTTGPMTNFALALLTKPEIKEHITEIVSMGGSIDAGNVTPAAEFNIYCDPEAAYVVLNSGIPFKMIGLNVTRKVLVLPEIIERMDKINNKASFLFSKLMKVFNENQFKTFGLPGGPLHDPVTIVSLLDENVVTYKDMNVSIDISHGVSYGRTNCDVADYMKRPSNCKVAIDIDVNKYWDIIEKGIRNYNE